MWAPFTFSRGYVARKNVARTPRFRVGIAGRESRRLTVRRAAITACRYPGGTGYIPST